MTTVRVPGLRARPSQFRPTVYRRLIDADRSPFQISSRSDQTHAGGMGNGDRQVPTILRGLVYLLQLSRYVSEIPYKLPLGTDSHD